MATLKQSKSNGSADDDLSRRPSVTTMLPAGDVPNLEGMDADEAALTALGYKQEFKREFSLWSTFCVSFAVLGLLPSFASTLYYGMGYAGTGGMVWGWLISWVFIQCVAMGMAELCSSMPTRWVFFDNMFNDANAKCFKWWIILCCRSTRASRMGSICKLDHRMVQLDVPNHSSTQCGLCGCFHDSCCRLNYSSRV